MILVTGVGRSGTSVMIQALRLAGLSVSQKGNYYEKFRAGYEDPEAVTINQSFLKHMHMDLSLEHVNFHKQRIQDLDLDAVKDPLFVAHPSIIQNWWKARQDLQIIYCRRSPSDIVKSQYRVITMNTPVYRTDTRLVSSVEMKFMEIVEFLKIPMYIVDYEDMPKDQARLDIVIKAWGYSPSSSVAHELKHLWEKR